MPVRSGSDLRRLLQTRLRGRAVGVPDAVGVARTLVAGGCRVGLEYVAEPDGDPSSGLLELARRTADTGLAPAVELTVPLDRLPVEDARRVVAGASAAGLAVVLAGPAEVVDAAGLPAAGVVVPAGEPGAESRCRALAGGHVHLVAGPRRNAATDLAFVRCLNILMAEEGRPGIAVSDPRLIAIAGERAAWNGRPPDSWELVMPFGVLVHDQRRLVAAGDTVRVTVAVGGRS